MLPSYLSFHSISCQTGYEIMCAFLYSISFSPILGVTPAANSGNVEFDFLLGRETTQNHLMTLSDTRTMYPFAHSHPHQSLAVSPCFPFPSVKQSLSPTILPYKLSQTCPFPLHLHHHPHLILLETISKSPPPSSPQPLINTHYPSQNGLFKSINSTMPHFYSKIFSGFLVPIREKLNMA